MMYCSETWAQAKAIPSSLKSADNNALRTITEVTSKDRVTNGAVIKITGLIDLDKLQVRSRLRWFDHVHRTENDHALQSTDFFPVPRNRPAGRP